MNMTMPKPLIENVLAELVVRLQDVGDVRKALKIALRASRGHFQADRACVALFGCGAPMRVALADGSDWTEPVGSDALRGQGARLPQSTIFAPIDRRGRRWGLLSVSSDRNRYRRGDLRELRRLARMLSRLIHTIDRRRILEVRSRIDRKLMEQLRPEDLFYQVLHGLRGLTQYTHSAAVLILDEECTEMTVAAEQIAWHKGKSRRIGHTLAVDGDALDLLRTGDLYGFDLSKGEWRDWDGRDAAHLARMLDFSSGEEDGSPREHCLICAPLTGRDGALGLLKIAACHSGELGTYEVDLVRNFLPHASIAMRNLQRTESLESRIIEAEKKHAMADLARGVSHDINNTLGSLIPLVQQMIIDAKDNTNGSGMTLLKDLEQIESSLQTSRRIFGGMLSFARGGTRHKGRCDIGQALENVMAITEAGLRNRKIQVGRTLDDSLEPVEGAQGDLDQLLLNLVTNAGDAMPGGGRIELCAYRADEHVELVVRDTGDGIDPEDIERIEEPFFTTRAKGSGLGLAICRSIVWGMRGDMSFESVPEQGTSVTVRLPLSGGCST